MRWSGAALDASQRPRHVSHVLPKAVFWEANPTQLVDCSGVSCWWVPDAAAGADIDVMNAATFEHFGAPDVVLPKCIAALDNNFIGRKQPAELDNRVFCDFACGQHDPDCPRRTQFVDERVQALGADITAHNGDSIGVMIIDDRLVTILDQAARNVAAHASEIDHADLHLTTRSRQSAFERGLQRLKSCRDLAVEMNTQRAPAALEQNIEVAAGLRVLHHAETKAVSGNGQVVIVV